MAGTHLPFVLVRQLSGPSSPPIVPSALPWGTPWWPRQSIGVRVSADVSSYSFRPPRYLANDRPLSGRFLVTEYITSGSWICSKCFIDFFSFPLTHNQHSLAHTSPLVVEDGCGIIVYLQHVHNFDPELFSIPSPMITVLSLNSQRVGRWRYNGGGYHCCYHRDFDFTKFAVPFRNVSGGRYFL